MDEYSRALNIAFSPYGQTMLLVSAITTWGIGLGIPALVRWFFLKQRLSRGLALLITIGLWLLNVFIFVTLLGTGGHSLFWIAIAAYCTLRAKGKPQEKTQANVATNQSVGHGGNTAWDVFRQQRL